MKPRENLDQKFILLSIGNLQFWHYCKKLIIEKFDALNTIKNRSKEDG